MVLWLNGGPGCTSMIGFTQEISPYVLEEGQAYEGKSNLTFNPYTWLNLSNLLFIDSPAGTGYSLNFESNPDYNDENTAKDSL